MALCHWNRCWEWRQNCFLCLLLWGTVPCTRCMMANSIVRSNPDQNKWHRWGPSEKKVLQLLYCKCQNNNKDLLCLTAVSDLSFIVKAFSGCSYPEWIEVKCFFPSRTCWHGSMNVQIHSSGARITTKLKPCKKWINAFYIVVNNELVNTTNKTQNYMLLFSV